MDELRTALVGRHISQSRFGSEMARLAAANGMKASHRNVDLGDRVEVDLPAILSGLQDDGFTGTAVTYPFKEAAAVWVGDAADSVVKLIGASNLVAFRPKLGATNTDYFGFLNGWRRVFGPMVPGRVAVAGAGGVSRAVISALKDLGAAEIVVWDQDEPRAASLAEAIGDPVRAVRISGANAALEAADGFANATPVGSYYAPGSPVDLDRLDGRTWVFDAIYTPINTPVVATARSTGVSVMTGFDLFRGMLSESFCALTGREAGTVNVPDIAEQPAEGA